MNHSELPWKVEEPFASKICIVVPWSDKVKPGNTALFGDYRGGCICELEFNSGVPTKEQATANASFIVRACNNHERLVEACKEAKSIISGMLGDKRYTGGYEDEVCAKLEQALQSAEEGR